MGWIQINIHTGQRELMTRDEVMSSARGMSENAREAFQANRRFDTAHNWYRPATDEDHRREELEASRRKAILMQQFNMTSFTFRSVPV